MLKYYKPPGERKGDAYKCMPEVWTGTALHGKGPITGGDGGMPDPKGTAEGFTGNTAPSKKKNGS